jgi:hypothetical protein
MADLSDERIEPPAGFVEWFAKNYSGDVWFSNPAWHARSIYRNAMWHARAIQAEGSAVDESPCRDYKLAYELERSRRIEAEGSAATDSPTEQTLMIEDTAEDFPVQWREKVRDCMRNAWVGGYNERVDEAGAVVEPPEPALVRFNQVWKPEDDGTDPIERLRAFCSFAMNGQDWIDSEPFFDALRAVVPSSLTPEPLPGMWDHSDLSGGETDAYPTERFEDIPEAVGTDLAKRLAVMVLREYYSDEPSPQDIRAFCWEILKPEGA